jgi:hypothetical protein
LALRHGPPSTIDNIVLDFLQSSIDNTVYKASVETLLSELELTKILFLKIRYPAQRKLTKI